MIKKRRGEDDRQTSLCHFLVWYRAENGLGPAARMCVLCLGQARSHLYSKDPESTKMGQWGGSTLSKSKERTVGKVFTLCTCRSQMSQTHTHAHAHGCCSCPSNRACVKSAQLAGAVLFLPNLLSPLLLYAYKRTALIEDPPPPPPSFHHFLCRRGKIIRTDQSA